MLHFFSLAILFPKFLPELKIAGECMVKIELLCSFKMIIKPTVNRNI